MPAEVRPMQHGVHFFKEIAFPCCVGRSCVVIPWCGASSRVTFSNILGTNIFVVLHLGDSGALFVNSPWPSVAVRFITRSPVLPFLCSGVYFFDLAAFWANPSWGTMRDREYSKSVPMQRGTPSFLRWSILMQRGARFLIFGTPLGGPTWPQ